MRGIVTEKLTPFLAQVNEAIAESKKQGIPFSTELVRANLDKLSTFIGQGPELTFVEDRGFKTDGRVIPVRVYSPSPNEVLPVVIHYHGGGHVCGSVALYDPICRKVAQQSHCIVISVEYRLAPEYPYPAGIDDCGYVLANYQECLEGLKFTPQVYIMGDSAGGAICTTLAMLSQQDASLKIDKQILIYPSVDYTGQQASFTDNGYGFLLEQDKIKWYFNQYFQHNEDPKTVSPLLGKMSQALPETLLITAGCDPLRDEGLAYVKALQGVGVLVQHYQFDALVHAYMLLDALVEEECLQTYNMISDFIAK
jgi:acetyl esterase